MPTVEIIFDPAQSKFSNLDICVDKKSVSYQLQDNSLLIDSAHGYGIHCLSIALTSNNDRLTITGVNIDQSAMLDMIYASYLKNQQGHIQQPATVLYDKSYVWNLPYGYPLSLWHTKLHQQGVSKVLGQNLFELFHVFEPEKLELDLHYPTQVRNFFNTDFDAVYASRETPLWKLPYAPTNFCIDTQLKNQAIQEIYKNQQWIIDNRKDSYYYKYNNTDFATADSSWSHIWLMYHGKTHHNLERFPCLFELIESFNINDLQAVMIGIMPPQCSLMPHFDQNTHDPECYYIYIPLEWPRGNYFKIEGAGIITDTHPCNINVFDYNHSAVNDSDQYRYIISLRFPVKTNPNILIG